jgi:replicative DNA helicase
MNAIDRQPVARQPANVEAQPNLPFGSDFQASLLRLLLEDSGFAHAVSEHLNPSYFESPPLAWAWAFCQRYQSQYGSMPTTRLLFEQSRSVDQRIRPLYTATIEVVAAASLREEKWIRDQVLEFIRRNVFVAAFRDCKDLYNAGKATEAYDLMMERMERIRITVFEQVDREWVCAGLPARQSARLGVDGRSDTITTGLRSLDKVLEGGLHLGELGIWIAEPKTGKTTMLVNHGIAGARLAFKNVLHCVFEGSRKQVVNRYDAAFSEELYSRVKAGEMGDKKYEVLLAEYKMLSSKLVVRAFTERWDYSVVDVHEEIRTLKREHGWEPQLVVVDYGDLLRGREKHYNSETEKQRAAYRDLKSLANRGYAVWSATQSKRPKEGDENKPRWLRSRDVADCYDKIRVSDFGGSINLTLEEKNLGLARLLFEYYRDNEAENSVVVRADFSRMLIKEELGLTSPAVPGMESSKLGQLPRQALAPI